jgi:hypothetical protein
MTSQDQIAIPSMIFIHIPFLEYKTSYDLLGTDSEFIYGQRRETNFGLFGGSNLFNAILELESTKYVFCGHLHQDDYSLFYRGIRLIVGNTTNIITGMSQSGILGGTVITIFKDGNVEV